MNGELEISNQKYVGANNGKYVKMSVGEMLDIEECLVKIGLKVDWKDD